ncbi:PREDICTED: L-ascorbate oxidase-like [Priapulus caudatus]|uniref:L-ascorbate oxidase-like n=1 Tax=Priapulus caudatus TaxID=37621 RepID=A0ABM1E2E9_PRICU|nr:PREDICTED: L-ascorbate oxidase-like [Priapulus caudatus]
MQVCEGDEIVVNVDNLLRNGEGVSIHWHGVHQRRTPYMDGVAQLTQCSIPAYTSFQYRFKADTPGTHFWHSHSGLQRADGLFGKLVIRQTPADDPNSHLYDFDLPEHEIIVTDWLNEPMMNEFPAHHHKQLNPLNTKGSRNLIPISNVKSLAPDDKSLNDPDMQLYLSFDFYKVDSTLFHDPSLYPIRAIEMGKHLYTPQVNHISAILPPSPPLTQYYDVPQNLICNETTRRNCDKEYCECVYMYKIPLGNVVEMVLIDEGVTFDASHPFHLHGYRFRVVAMDRVNKSGVTADDVRRLDREGLIARKLSGAPLKDTVTVPDGGYTIIRFHADNPGIWFFHCHIAFHAEIGMAVVMQVGEPTDFPYPPYKFPRCGNFAHTRGAEPPPGEEYLESIGRRNRARYGSHHTDSGASDKSLGCILAVFCCFCAFFRLT